MSDPPGGKTWVYEMQGKGSIGLFNVHIGLGVGPWLFETQMFAMYVRYLDRRPSKLESSNWFAGMQILLN